MVMTAGALSTPMALTDSQNIPSAVDAFPMVAQVTSSPLWEKRVWPLSDSSSRYRRDAYARPTARGIWAAVGETSAATLYIAVWSRHEPSGLMKRETKCPFMERPAVAGSYSRSV